MTKFKVGQRVRATVKHGEMFWPNACVEGEVLEGVVLARFDDDSVTVNFGARFEGHSGGNNLCPHRTAWHVNDARLELADPIAPEVSTEVTSGAPAGTKQQTDRILAHLLSGHSITQLEAFGVFRIFRLAARIHELKAKGHKIKTDMKRDATGKLYAEYSLVSRRVR